MNPFLGLLIATVFTLFGCLVLAALIDWYYHD